MELKRANEILKKAAAFFAQAELDRRAKVMVAFIDQHRDAYGVESMCALLAPSTSFLRKAQQQDPTQRSARAQRDDELRPAIQRVWDANEQVCGPARSGGR